MNIQAFVAGAVIYLAVGLIVRTAARELPPAERVFVVAVWPLALIVLSVCAINSWFDRLMQARAQRAREALIGSVIRLSRTTDVPVRVIHRNSGFLDLAACSPENAHAVRRFAVGSVWLVESAWEDGVVARYGRYVASPAYKDKGKYLPQAWEFPGDAPTAMLRDGDFTVDKEATDARLALIHEEMLETMRGAKAPPEEERADG